MPNKLDKSISTDIQGIILYGYGHMSAASYLMLHIKDNRRADVKKWLGLVSDQLTHAGGKEEGTSINLALTEEGLKALGMPDSVMASFPRPFREGMKMEHKSVGFGDIGMNAPEHWEWGNEDKAHEIHILLMLFAENDQMLEKYELEQIERLDAHGLQVMHHFDTESFMHDARKEHFGFTDGIGQPNIRGVKNTDDFEDNEINLGEFVLGHKNEYGKLPDSPCVPSDMDKQNFLETLPNDLPNTRDLGNNGSFMVFRQLEQDVKAFWEYIEGVVEERKKAGEEENLIRVASKMVGRWPNGSPMAINPHTSGEATNHFGYADKDLKGFGCPIGAHLRRANPRDTFTDDPEKSIKFVKKNRIARRGRGYGKPIDKNFNPETILQTEVTEKRRGLHFLAFNSHLARQFELVQKQWMCNPKFLGLYDEVDPIVGHHTDFEGVKFNEFTEPSHPIRKKTKQIPRFITMKGGAYFFMPGVKAVKFLANA